MDGLDRSRPTPAMRHHGRVSTQTEVAPDRTDTDSGDRVFHYVRKAKITESAVTGAVVEALCGERFPVTQTPKPGSPVCGECRKIYDGLLPGSD